MGNIILVLFFIELVLVIYVLGFLICFNVLLFKNKDIVESYFKQLGYKLFIYDDNRGKIVPRKQRIETIAEIVNGNASIKSRKLFSTVLKLHKSLYIVVGIFIFNLLITIFITICKWIKKILIMIKCFSLSNLSLFPSMADC